MIKKKTATNALTLCIPVILAMGMSPVVMSMEDGLAPPNAHPDSGKSKSAKSPKSKLSGTAADDQALGGHKQESLRPPATPNGLVNPCQMADSPKWCDGQ